MTPALTTSFQVLNYIVNKLAYNPEGKEEGFLFWTAWFLHNGMSFLSSDDANGASGAAWVFDCNQTPTQSPG